VPDLSPEGVIEEFLTQWCDAELHRMMPEPQLVANSGVLELTALGVFTEHQGRGFARRTLELLTSLCDTHGVTIMLIARQLPEGFAFEGCKASRDEAGLIALYQKFDFVTVEIADDGIHTMKREPRDATKS
jgi:GNAT superfamily N-acetyltransferase